MELKKLLALGLSLSIAVGAVGCSKKTNTTTDGNTSSNTATEQNKYVGSEYANQYTGLYNTNISPLSSYSIYTTVDDVNNAYKDKDYPGNEKYIADVKAAYKDSKEKIQAFVDGLKKDAKTDDADLKAANDKLIAEGEKLISEIDVKMKKLDEIPKDAYTKSKEEFIKLVDDTTKVENSVTTSFDKMIIDMNKMLGIDTTPSTKTTK